MIPGFRHMQERTDDINRVLREQIVGIRVVRAFVRERSETERFGETNDALTDAAISVGRWMMLMFPTVMLVFNVSSVAVLWFGAGPVEDGSLQIGALTAFLSYLMQILMAVMMATFVGIMAPRAAVSAERIGEVLGTDVIGGAAGTAGHRSSSRHGEVELRDVTFRYPGAESPVLRGVSFTVGPGQTTAIVGSTGAGKTTLVNLIPRLFDVTSGAVLIDGVDVRDLDEELLWSRIGMVPQAGYLFSGTVASNLRLGRPDATDDQMWDALEVAQAADFVRAHARRSGGAGRPGRDEPVGRAAPAPRHRPGARSRAGDLRLRRRLLCARPRDRRPTARRTRTTNAPSGGDHRRPAGLDDHRRRPDRRPRRRRGRRQRPPRRAAGDVPDVRRDRRVAGRPGRRRDVGRAG